MDSGSYSEGPGESLLTGLSALHARMALPKTIDRLWDPFAAKIFLGQYSCGPGVQGRLLMLNLDGPEPNEMFRVLSFVVLADETFGSYMCLQGMSKNKLVVVAWDF
jgi:hypothetical protein